MLRRCFPASVRKSLDELPETLDEIYERILMGIKKPDREHAHRLLQCLVVAIRPLRVEELAEVLAVDFGPGGTIPRLNENWRWANQDEAVQSTCSSLVSIVNIDGSRVVQFSHPSVEEFLTSDRLATSSGHISSYHISLEPAHETLARACLGVLLRSEDHLDRDSIEDFPLADYAAKHWVDHARFENVTSHIKGAIELLFDPDKPHFANWVWIYDMDEPSRSPTPHAIRPNATPLYYAALCGFDSLAEQLIDERHVDINAQGGHYVTAIQAALYKRHLSIARLLIEHGADANFRNDDVSSLLHMAAQTGDPKTVSFLLSHGAHMQATDSGHSPALFSALDTGNLAVIQLLIKYGANVNARDDNLSTALKLTPLHLALNNENFDIAKLLIKKGADVNIPDDKKRLPLHLALFHKDSDLVDLLVEHGANVNARDNNNSTPLHIASRHGPCKSVDLLLEHGGDPNLQDDSGFSPLHIASQKGDIGIAESLLKGGAKVNLTNKKSRAPLHLAVDNKHIALVGSLLTHGGDPNVRDDGGVSPLHIASQKGDIYIAESLLKGGAKVNLKDWKRKTPLHMAANNKKMALFLIQRGADAFAMDKDKDMPLQFGTVNKNKQSRALSE